MGAARIVAAGRNGADLLALAGRLVLMGSMTVPLPLSYGDIMANDRFFFTCGVAAGRARCDPCG
jgi:hypothetical protein